MTGHCFAPEHVEFGLESLPQGERRDIVLRGGGKEGARQEIAVLFSGARASLGSKSCRGASTGILFCWGEEGRQGIVLSRGMGGVWARRAAAGRAPGDCSAYGGEGVGVRAAAAA